MAMEQTVSLSSSTPFSGRNFVRSPTYSDHSKHFGNPDEWLKCLEEDIGAEMTVKSTATDIKQETDNTPADDLHPKEAIFQLSNFHKTHPPKYQEIGNGSTRNELRTAPSPVNRATRFKRDTAIANGHSYAAKRKKVDKPNKTDKELLKVQFRKTEKTQNPERGPPDDDVDSRTATKFALLESFEVAKILCSLPELIAEREGLQLSTNNNNRNNTVLTQETEASTNLTRCSTTASLLSSAPNSAAFSNYRRVEIPKLDDIVFNRVVDMIRYNEGDYDEPNDPEDYPDWVDAVRHSLHGVDIDSTTWVTYNQEGGLALQHGRRGKRKIKRKMIFDI